MKFLKIKNNQFINLNNIDEIIFKDNLKIEVFFNGDNKMINYEFESDEDYISFKRMFNQI